MEISVYYSIGKFTDENSPLVKSNGFETIEYEEQTIGIPPKTETCSKEVRTFDDDSKTNLKTLYSQGYRLIIKDKNQFFLERG